jgi:IS5 family transposase
VLSIFEPQTEVIRKGKAAKPTEFGKVLKLQETENQFITDDTVCPTRVPDGELWMPALERHAELFGRPPDLAVADASFSSRANERAAHARGVRRVVLPRGAASHGRAGFAARSAGERAVRVGSAC